MTVELRLRNLFQLTFDSLSVTVFPKDFVFHKILKEHLYWECRHKQTRFPSNYNSHQDTHCYNV